MNYEFPIITCLDDVLPHIEGRDEFRVMRKDGYIVVNYAVAFDTTFEWDESDPLGSAIRRECRGLVFAEGTGEIVSRPFHKFFNVNERAETSIDKISLSVPHRVLTKLDGSMIRPIPFGDGAWRLGTKAGITDVAMNAEVWIAHPDRASYRQFVFDTLYDGFTPIFEWCSRSNRIVVDYPEERLVLLTVRSTETGAYLSYDSLRILADTYSLELVASIELGGHVPLPQLVNVIREWEDAEGIVIRFDDGHMVKIKADDYVLKHRAKDSIRSERNVLELVLDDNVDDVVPLLTQYEAGRLREFQKAFWLGLDDVASDTVDIYLADGVEYEEQKDFAQCFVASLPRHLHPVMFALRKGRGARDILVELAKKSLSSQTKIDASRWIWGGLTWTL